LIAIRATRAITARGHVAISISISKIIMYAFNALPICAAFQAVSSITFATLRVTVKIIHIKARKAGSGRSRGAASTLPHAWPTIPIAIKVHVIGAAQARSLIAGYAGLGAF
jgi:hypothetical protein